MNPTSLFHSKLGTIRVQALMYKDRKISRKGHDHDEILKHKIIIAVSRVKSNC